MKPVIAVQYLEYHNPLQHTLEAVRQCLQDAFDRLPISLVLLGWSTPRSLVEVCAEVTTRHQARLFLWHPLLTSDGVFFPLPEWCTVGLNGEIVTGFHGEPDFTFVCPNHTAGREAVLQRLVTVLRGSPFQGVFLDRLRFPSPAAAPDSLLGCFCTACQQAAASVAASLNMTVGLDCFTPSLTRMVGQDLGALNSTCEWIKIMTYPHTLAPAGLPFELLGLTSWLTTRYHVSQVQVQHCLAKASGLPIPSNLSELHTYGLPPEATRAEIELGRSLGINQLLVGMALVDLPGKNSASAEQHAADLAACHSANPDGLVLSWDLWHISPERLEQVAALI